MIKYYYVFGVEYFKICKMFDLDGQVMLISFNEAPPMVENFDFEDEGEYKELKKFLNI